MTAAPAYAGRVLRIAAGLLAQDGMAMIQVKYRTADPRTAPRRWAYRRNLASNTTFGIDEFWLKAAEFGLRPALCMLLPKDQVANDERYAYYALLKQPPAASGHVRESNRAGTQARIRRRSHDRAGKH